MERTNKSVSDRVMVLISDRSFRDTIRITPETNLISEMEFDSLDMVDLSIAIEVEFDISISGSNDPFEWVLVKDVVGYVEEKLAQLDKVCC